MQKLTFRFERLIIDRKAGIMQNVIFFPQLLRLYMTYLRHLEDDFSNFSHNPLISMLNWCEKVAPHLYLVITGDELCGFFCLENFVGMGNNLHSAQVVTCFEKKYWGTFTKHAGLIFKKYCFGTLGLKKLKALIYPQNSRVKAILHTCGFVKEALFKAETLKNGRLQDIEVYSVLNKGAQFWRD